MKPSQTFVDGPEHRLRISGYKGPEGIDECLGNHEGKSFKMMNLIELEDANKKRKYWWGSYEIEGKYDHLFYTHCCNLNGVYRNNGEIEASEPEYNIYWNSFKDSYEPLKRVRMSVLLE